MTRVEYLVLDAFTARSEGPVPQGAEGNRAGVVLDATRLDRDAMAQAARQIDAPTTGFVRPDVQGGFELSFFTPRREIPMCGHVVVGVSSALAQAGRGEAEPSGARRFHFNTAAGPVAARVETDLEVRQRHPLPRFRSAEVPAATLAAALGLELDDLSRDLPVGVAGTGLEHLLVPLVAGEAGVRALGRIEPDRAALEQLERALRVDTVGVFAPVDLARGEVRLRDFTCGLGPREEPGSGTTNAALLSHLWRAGALPAEEDGSRRHVLRSRQGVEMGRPSRITVRLAERGGKITQVEVAGRARPAHTPRVLELRTEIERRSS